METQSRMTQACPTRVSTHPTTRLTQDPIHCHSWNSWFTHTVLHPICIFCTHWINVLHKICLFHISLIYIFFNTHTCYNCTITCPPATNGDVTNSAHLIKVPIENFQWKCPLLTLISSASIGDFNSSVFLYFFSKWRPNLHPNFCLLQPKFQVGPIFIFLWIFLIDWFQ